MKSRGRVFASAAMLAAVFAFVGCGLSRHEPPTDANSTCGPSLTVAEFNGWFESGTPSLNGAVKPANSVQFPDVPNCSFYKWSEQMFLWLTSPAPPRYGSNGLVFNTPAFFDVSPPDANGERQFTPHTAGLMRAFNLRTAQRGLLDLPIVLEKGTLRMLEVLPQTAGPTGRPLVADGDGNEVEVGNVRFGANNTPILLTPEGAEIRAPRALLRSSRERSVRPFDARLARMEAFDRSELVQKLVFDRRVILLDLFGHFPETEQGQADRGVLMAQNGSLVYYTTTVNNVFALYRTMFGATVPPGTKFPMTQTDLNAITAFATSHGKAPVIDSEALAVEIKTSWIEADRLVDADRFIQMRATVPTYDKSNPNDWVPNGTKVVNLAMVGMHVVGSTGSTNAANTNHGHPEMLWATFEHVSNSPLAEYTYTKTGGGNATVAQNTAGNWVFTSSGATAPFNEPHMMMGGPNDDHIVAIAPFSISASNVLRTMPWGLPGSRAGDNADVISLNAAVRSRLDAADIRRNYVHEGTTWTIFGASPTSSNQVGNNQVGTNKLENATLETFSQGDNCFSCHATNTTNVSHVFSDTKPLF